MNIYCGTDIIEVERIKNAILDNDNFIANIFTASEIEYCEVKNDEQRFMHYAGRFAAKEAIYKAIAGDKDMANTVTWLDIEVLNDYDNNKRPYATIKKIDNLNIDVSISHIKDYAVANCIVVIN